MGGFILAASGSVFAADIAVKAPPPAPPPAFSWTGWYVGVNGGLAAQSKDSHVTGFNTEAEFPSTTTGGAVIDPVGGFGGGQIGYNWQVAPQWVAGFEADIQGGSIQDSATATAGSPNADDGPLFAYAKTNLDWFGTVRARVGYTFLDQRVLSYVTGGFAFGGVRDTLSVSEASSGEPLLFGTVSSHTTKTGWIVGYGIEGYFTPALSLRVESDYMSLGSTTLATGTQADGGGFDFPFATANLNHKYWLLRAGLNYKFGTW